MAGRHALIRVALGEASVLPVIESGQAELVGADESIDSSAWLEPARGHTPGHVTLHLKSKGSEAILAGDVFHHPLQIAEPQLRAEYPDIDPEAAEATRIAFLNRYTDEEVMIVGGHFAHPSGGWIRTENRSRRFIPA